MPRDNRFADRRTLSVLLDRTLLGSVCRNHSNPFRLAAILELLPAISIRTILVALTDIFDGYARQAK